MKSIKKNSCLGRNPNTENTNPSSSILEADAASSTLTFLPHMLHHLDGNTTPSLDGTSTSNSAVVSPLHSPSLDSTCVYGNSSVNFSTSATPSLALEDPLVLSDQTSLNKETWGSHFNGISPREPIHLDYKAKDSGIVSGCCHGLIEDDTSINDAFNSSNQTFNKNAGDKITSLNESFQKKLVTSLSNAPKVSHPLHESNGYKITVPNESFQQISMSSMTEVPHPLQASPSGSKECDLDTSVRGGCSRNVQNTDSQGKQTPTIGYNFNNISTSAAGTNEKGPFDSTVSYKIGFPFNKSKLIHEQNLERQDEGLTKNHVYNGKQIKSVIPASLIYRNGQSLDPPVSNANIKKDNTDAPIQAVNIKDCNFLSKSEIKAVTSDSAVRGGTIFKNFKFKCNAKLKDPKKKTNQDYFGKNISFKTKQKNNSFGCLAASLIRKKDIEPTMSCSLNETKRFSCNGALIGGGGVAQSVSIQLNDIKKANGHCHRKKEMKLASAYAFLGEEKSIHNGKNFTTFKSAETPATRKLSDHSFRLGSSAPSAHISVVPGGKVVRSSSVLYPLMGPESWEKNKRYLIAPAIFSICRLTTLSAISNVEETIDISQLERKNDRQLAHNSLVGKFNFKKALTQGKKILVRASAAQLGCRKSLDENYGWFDGLFVVWQNYLFEYQHGDNLSGPPRGFALLEHSAAYPHLNFVDTLQLDFYQSPCSRDKLKTIIFRLKSISERDSWLECLQKASQLRVEDFYEFDSVDSKNQLGKGRFATVLRARRRHKNLRGCESTDKRKGKGNGKDMCKPISAIKYSNDYDCALKIIDKNTFWDHVKKGKERADTLAREVAIQMELTAQEQTSSPFLHLRNFFETADNIIIELELLEGEDLFRHVVSKGCLEEVETAHIMYDVLSCLSTMNRIGIVHRDVKLSNILMATGSSGVRVKLGDFGMSTFVGVDNRVHGRCGTPGYVAPEILSAGVNDGYSNKIDTFSAGVTLYTLLCGYEPFYGDSDEEVFKANKAGKVEYPNSDWDTISLEGRDLVERMLNPNPEKRINPGCALKHPWITRRITCSKSHAIT